MFPRPGRIIVPQYEPTPGLSLVAAAELLGDSKRAIAAQVIDFAVRRVVGIARDPQAGRRRDGFTLVLRGLDPLAPAETPAGADERDILAVLFGASLEPGARRDIRPKRNRDLGVALREPHRRAVARLVAGGLARQRGAFERAVVFWRQQPTEPTAKAEPAVDHLWGIRDYIALAEQDRMAYLQTPRGALTKVEGDLEIVHLHERLLPYAVLFGLEKEWMRDLDLRYRSLPPDTLAALDTVGDVLEVGALAIDAVSLVADLAELGTILDAGEALEGAGAFLGGLGEALSNIDFPDFPDFG